MLIRTVENRQPHLGTIAKEHLVPQNSLRAMADPKIMQEKAAKLGKKVPDKWENYIGGYPYLLGVPRAVLAEYSKRAFLNVAAIIPDPVNYGSTEGELALRGTIAEKVFKPQGIDAVAERIYDSAGGSQLLLSTAFGILINRDQTVVFKSVHNYPGADSASLPHKPKEYVEISQGENAFNTAELKEHLQKLPKREDGTVDAIIYVSNPFSNPSGASLNNQEITELGELANEFGFYIIQDGAYRRFSYGNPPSTIKLQDVTPHVIELGTFSKELYAAGRFGYALLPPHKDLLDTMSGLLGGLQVCPNGVVGETTRLMVTDGVYEKHLQEVIPKYKERLETGRRTVYESFPEGTKLADGNNQDVFGGIFVTPILPEGYDTTDIITAIIESGVGYLGGSDLTMNPDLQRRILRIAVANKELDQIQRDLTRLGEHFRSQAKR